MRNRLVFHIAVFCCLCASVFAQNTDSELTEADNFIDRPLLYQKYLPLEDIPDYFVVRQRLIEAKEEGEFDQACDDLSIRISGLNDRFFENLNGEISQKNEKMDELNSRFSSNRNVQELNREYEAFKENIDSIHDDDCLAKIDELYSRLIIRVGYGHGRRRSTRYTVEAGDYLRRIAVKVYGDERLWTLIWRDEVNYRNREFLPNPSNPNLILPHAEIRIPAKQ